MKSRKVDTITSDEQHVRLSIFDGEIPLGEAGGKLLDLTLKKFHRDNAVVSRLIAALEKHNELQECAMTPWPVRWWWWFRKKA